MKIMCEWPVFNDPNVVRTKWNRLRVARYLLSCVSGGLSNDFVVVVVALFLHFLWSSIANHLSPNVDSTESAEKQHRPFIYPNTNETNAGWL